MTVPSPSPQATLMTIDSPPPEPTTPCAVTLGNGSSPPGETRVQGSFGNGRLWTILWPEGAVYVDDDAIEPDGSLGMKFPWWRGADIDGALSIRGHELERGLPVRASIPDGYGTTGFQATGILFPVEGCYTVTGSAADAELTFVTLVRTCAAVAELPPERQALYVNCGY